MFGSNDDKKTPAAAGEKKSLFGWLRKKPQETVAEQPQPQPEPVEAPVAEEAAPIVLPIAEPVLQPAEPEAEPVVEPVLEQPLTPPAGQTPWLTLPVAEEPVALVEDAQAPHVTPPIPAPTQPEEASTAVVVPPLPELVPEPEPAEIPVPAEAPRPIEENKVGFFARLKQGLSKTSASIGEGMASLFLGKKVIDDELLEDIETRLLTADVGVEATSVIIQSLTQKVARKQLTDADALYKSLQGELTNLLKPVEQPLVVASQNKPFVILVVGVNGAGKTTTIGKLAKKLQLEGKKVMLAAGDTFRAAAVEQLQVWGDRKSVV